MRTSDASAHGIYLHMPWCASICPYCAFYKERADNPDFDAWLEGILRDWEHWRSSFPGTAHSLYFGGGTPSLAPASILGSAIERLPHTEDAEITVEVNPGTIDPVGLTALRSVGVNRLSLGIQSLEPSVARVLARGHTAAQARILLEMMPSIGFRTWSVDLMFAVPGQTVEMLDRDLDFILAADAPHVSLYGLGIEPNTTFDRLRSQGLLRLPDEDTWAELFDRIHERLGSEGYIRYEISNFARPGHEAIHNGAIWRGGPYVGLGPSAHGFAPSGRRWQNPANIESWLRGDPVDGELPNPLQAAIDYVLSSLRHREGSNLDHMAKRTGYEPNFAILSELIDGGMLLHDSHCVRLSQKAIPISDAIISKLCRNLVPIGSQPGSFR